MGISTEERTVMHWQSARFFDRPSVRSPTLQLINQCIGANNTHALHRKCPSCPNSFDHNAKILGRCPIFNDSCARFNSSERVVFDEASISYSVVDRVECPDSLNSVCSAIPLKTEPCGPPSSPESSPEITFGPEDCAGCGRLIQDRFYLSAIEKRWHVGCLQCCVCHQALDGDTSCFSRDCNIYCKSDYYK